MTKAKPAPSFAKTFDELPGWPDEPTPAYQRFIMIQVSKRRYQIARLTTWSRSRVDYPGASGYVKQVRYEAVTQPLSYNDAHKTYTFLVAREDDAIPDLPQEILALVTEPTL